MAITIALHHRTVYQYDRLVTLSPQVVRLRPAPHVRTTVRSYSLRIEPSQHFVNWQQDAQGNFLCRLTFPEQTRAFVIEMDLVAELSVVNPFDFFLEPEAEQYPFDYPPGLRQELAPYREMGPAGPLLQGLLRSIDRTPVRTVDFLVAMNRLVQDQVGYVIRMEPGVQTSDETLATRSGSCRDSSWLLVELLRHLGFAARFVSGYLIQLKPDVKPLDGPPGPDEDFTDLHAWAEVYLPGAGWIGLDPTSGLLAGEGHIPLAASPHPDSAAPVSGLVSASRVELHHEMSVRRIHEDPRVTKPYSDEQWQAIETLGDRVDADLQAHDVRLTMGGEPTFVSIDDMDGDEWNTAATGPDKQRLAAALIRRLQHAFARGGLLHFGQGKWYPGESLPRWAYTCYWRTDGVALWRDPSLVGDVDRDYGFTERDAQAFAEGLADRLAVGPDFVMAAYEDPLTYIHKERELPINVNPIDNDLDDPEERDRLRRVFSRGLGTPTGFVLPLARVPGKDGPTWQSGLWMLRSRHLFLLPGDSPVGLRLPLASLQAGPDLQVFPLDPLGAWPPLHVPPAPPRRAEKSRRFTVERPGERAQLLMADTAERGAPRQHVHLQTLDSDDAMSPVVRTALAVEARQGKVWVFLPPVASGQDYAELVAAIEDTARATGKPVLVEGYPPPHDPRLQQIKVTPDPGVIEVNVHPARSWHELVATTTTLYEQARHCRLGTEKFMLDGRHTGTGGGNHVVIGGATAADSPFLRRPDLLRSCVAYWLNHPSLSYLFSGTFIGPTSQAPRVDETRPDAVYELEIAMRLLPNEPADAPPWLVDRLFRNLLVDVTGNTHRAEFCIDKLYSPDSSSGRLGLLELRAFEMPPHPRMSLAQQLLVRTLIAWFWRQPYTAAPIRWGTRLHDRFLLPHYVEADLRSVLDDLRRAGYVLDESWFAPHVEFRFPRYGRVNYEGVEIELRQAIEPWYVLGEEPGGGGTARFVDSSVERLQVRARGLVPERFVVTCNGITLPLHATGAAGEFVCGVRYRAWQPPRCLHPTVPVHTPLVFDLVDLTARRSVGGCTYHVAHPGGRNYDTFPVNSHEAEARRRARFFDMGHTPGAPLSPTTIENPEFPATLDLRRAGIAVPASAFPIS